MNIELDVALRTGRLRRLSRPAQRAAGDLPRSSAMVGIAERDPEVEDRSVPGHWEGDLVEGSKASNSAIVTLVERQTCATERPPYERAHQRSRDHRHPGWSAGDTRTAAQDLDLGPGQRDGPPPRPGRRSEIKVYFCDPHSPWQRPSNENTNGLIREYYPQGHRLPHRARRRTCRHRPPQQPTPQRPRLRHPQRNPRRPPTPTRCNHHFDPKVGGQRARYPPPSQRTRSW